MRCVLVFVLFLIPISSIAATPSTEELQLEAIQSPGKLNPRLELARRLIKSGDNQTAHVYLREILRRHPDNKDAQKLMKLVLLSEAPLLGASIKPDHQTDFFFIPHLPRKHEYIKSVQLDAYIERWHALVKQAKPRKKIALLLFDSEESFLVASRGKRRLFIKQHPITIGIDPSLNRDSLLLALREGLVDLWIDQIVPKVTLPKGLRAGLIGALSPLEPHHLTYLHLPVMNLLETQPLTDSRRFAATAFVQMLHELNSNALSSWLKDWGRVENPMRELLVLYRFRNWKEVHTTFKDYLKKQQG